MIPQACTPPPSPARVIEYDGLAAIAVHFPAAGVVVVRKGLDDVTRQRVLRELLDVPPAEVP